MAANIAFDARELTTLTEQYSAAVINRTKWMDERKGHYQQIIDKHEKTRQIKTDAIKKWNSQTKLLTDKIAKLKNRSQWLIVGGLFTGSLVNTQKEKQEIEKRLQQARQKLEEASKEKTRTENIRDKEISESEIAFHLEEKVKITQEAKDQFEIYVTQKNRRASNCIFKIKQGTDFS